MSVHLWCLFYLILSCHGQVTPLSPCPDMFMYEVSGVEPSRWYGVVKLSTDNILYTLWVDIVLDGKANLLGNWLGEVTTTDNTNFKIENTNVRIYPGDPTALRFFVQYDPIEKVPALQAIKLNGREICNANTPLPFIGRPETDTFTNILKQDGQSQSKNEDNETVIGSQPKLMQGQRLSSPGDIIDLQNDFRARDIQTESQNQGNLTVTSSPPDFMLQPQTTSTESWRFFDTEGFSEDKQTNEHDFDYFTGRLIKLMVGEDILPISRDKIFDNKQAMCGKVANNDNAIPLVVNGKPTPEGRWPWQIALYQTEKVAPKFKCGGSLISHEHIITAAHCVTMSNTNIVVNKNTLTVYLGKHNLRTSVEGVQVRFVAEIIVHPAYDGNTLQNDLSVLKLRESVQFTDRVRPVCLWPKSREDLQYVVGKMGSVVGWGYNKNGILSEELTLVEMPVVNRNTCISSYREFFEKYTSNNTYCAGFRNGTSACGGDSGGGMVFNIEETWYLRGLVSLAVQRKNEYRCDASHYVVFTDLAKYLPWLNGNTVSWMKRSHL